MISIRSRQLSTLVGGTALLALLTFGCSNVSRDGDRNIVATGPRLFIKTDSWDFGEIQEGDEVTEEIVVQNTGSKELLIEHIKIPCSCLKTNLGVPVSIPPGETMAFNISLNSMGYMGKISLPLLFSTNEIEYPERRFDVLAEVKTSSSNTIQAIPKSILLGMLDDANWEKCVVIRLPGPMKYSDLEIASTDHRVKTALSRIEEAECDFDYDLQTISDKYQFVCLNVKCDSVLNDEINETVRITCKNGDFGEIRVPIRGLYAWIPYIFPQHLELKLQKSRLTTRQMSVLIPHDCQSCKIDVAEPPSGINVEIGDIFRRGNVIDFSIRFNPDDEISNVSSSELRLRITCDADYFEKVITIQH